MERKHFRGRQYLLGLALSCEVMVFALVGNAVAELRQIIKPVTPIKEPVSPRVFNRNVRDEERLPPNAGQVAEPASSNPWMTNLGSLSDPLQSFDGASSGSNKLEHDPVGDVGPNHYVQMINIPGRLNNAAFAIYDKRGNLLAGPSFFNLLWEAGPCRSGAAGDPIVLYDPLADRWLLSQMAAPNHLCMAVSITADPTERYFLYEFDVDTFPDYFKLGVWTDGYYMSARPRSNSGTQAAVFERAAMLRGQAARMVKFDIAVVPGHLGFDDIFMPSDLDGSTAPPIGSPNFFYRPHDGNPPSLHGNDWIELWELHVDWLNPDMSTFTGPPDISTFTGPPDIALPDFDLNLLCRSGECVPQRGTQLKLFNLHHKPMWRFQYRNFGSHETLVGNFTVAVDDQHQHGIRWFELRRSGNSAWVRWQDGTHAPQLSGAPDFVQRWMGSAAMDGFGNIALGYSVSSATDIYPSIRYTGRVPTDTLNQLPQPEKTIADGKSNTGPPSVEEAAAWGGYSSLNVDPADDCTFWYTNDYMASDGTKHTRIASFSFSSCNANELRIVNDLVTLTATAVQPTTTPDARCPAGTVGIFRFNAILRVKNINPLLYNFVLRVNTLTNGNLLIGDGGVPGGVGTTRTNLGTLDRPVSPEDEVGTAIEICLRNRDRFTFLVDVLAKNFIQ